MSAVRNTKPREYLERPKENHKRISHDDMSDLLGKISDLSSEDLAIVMTSVSEGLIRQRDAAAYRAVDFETAVGNIAMRPTVTRKTWQFITEEFLRPHERAFRNPNLMNWLESRVKSPISTKTIDEPITPPTQKDKGER